MVRKEYGRPSDIEIDKEGIFPRSVDINPTALCNLSCSFCWGPDHNIPDGLSGQDWIKIIDFFANGGTTDIVFTGGEPLIRKDLPELLKHSKKRQLNVTLSTNTLLLPNKHQDVLPYIDEIGIPLDGSSPERNQKMRKGTIRAFQSALHALELVSGHYPEIHTTVRTVVSRQNIYDIHNIGHILNQRSAMFDRWKIYQFTPVSIGLAHLDEHYLSRSEFDSVTESLHFPELNVEIYPNEQRTGRYVFVGPEGNIFGVDESGNYRVVSNFLNNNEDEVLTGIRQILNPSKNNMHGSK